MGVCKMQGCPASYGVVDTVTWVDSGGDGGWAGALDESAVILNNTTCLQQA